VSVCVTLNELFLAWAWCITSVGLGAATTLMAALTRVTGKMTSAVAGAHSRQQMGKATRENGRAMHHMVSLACISVCGTKAVTQDSAAPVATVGLHHSVVVLEFCAVVWPLPDLSRSACTMPAHAVQWSVTTSLAQITATVPG
jgi:hypothetical protein